MTELSRPDFDPSTAERAFGFQIADRAAENLDGMTERATVEELPTWLAQQALQRAFENPYVVSRGN